MTTYIVIGLGFGDEGKGTVVDYLTREYKAHTVIRFNGGAQAAHNVVTPDGQHHTFAQFGSGTLAGARTHLSRFMLVNPFDLYNEAQHLQQLGIDEPFSMLTISPQALITTPLHIVANQVKEERRHHKHGTCGKGIGETQEIANLLGSAAIRAEDLRRQRTMEAKLEQLSAHYSTVLDMDFAREHGSIRSMAKSYREFSAKIEIRDDLEIHDLLDHTLVFEGAQGILLDQDVGFHPHTTWSRTTTHNARELLDDAPATVIGVTRPYTTRHGDGPLIEGSLELNEPHNGSEGFQGLFRGGAWDALLIDYAAKCDHVDSVAVTCLDHLKGDWASVWSYEYMGDMPDLSPYFWADNQRIFQVNPGESRAHAEAIATRLRDCTANMNTHHGVDADYVADAMGEVLHAPVVIQSFGPTYKDKKQRVFTWAS